jgi:glycosyltransferase involved in cell wall biosynthesis
MDVPLRVALVAGTLGRGGAEQQLVYMARTLRDAGVDVQVYCSTRGDHHESTLKTMGLSPVWFGRSANPPMRLLNLVRQLRGFRPHVIQSVHFYTNPYAALASGWLRAEAIGGIRNDLLHELQSNRPLGPWILKSIPSVIANSHTAKSNACTLGYKTDSFYVLPNAIDLDEFDAGSAAESAPTCPAPRPLAVAVGRLVSVKRFDRFLEALTLAQVRGNAPAGMVVGGGPEEQHLRALAGQLGLAEGDLQFLGARGDVPALLRRADMLVLTSDHEGFPNVLLEAMAARLPVITTRAGDAAHVVCDGVTGFVVDFDGVESLAQCMTRLAKDLELRRSQGEEGRRRVEQCYGIDRLARNLLAIYAEIAERRHNKHLRTIVERYL